jgi:hypothetical protein
MEFLEKTRTPRKHTCDKCNGSDVQKLLSGFAVGRSKPTNQACETCPSGPCPTDLCQGGSCPANMGI